LSENNKNASGDHETAHGVRAFRFAEVAANYPGTAAGLGVPLALLHDVVRPPTAGYRNRHLDFFSLYVIRQGRGTHVIDGAAYGVARGDVYVMGPGMTHHLENVADLAADTLHFAPFIFAPEDIAALGSLRGFRSLFVEEREATLPPPPRNNTGGRWLHLAPDAYGVIAEQVGELRGEWASGTPEGALLTRCLFLRLLVRLSRFHAPAGGNNDAPDNRALPLRGHEATVAAALRFMEANFTLPLRIEQVAQAVFLSPDRFTEVFGQAMGQTPRDYLRHLRVERAKKLLATTDTPIGAIALAVGFAEAAYLARVFRAETGMSPRELRKTKQNPAA